jgi:hypothetical protein
MKRKLSPMDAKGYAHDGDIKAGRLRCYLGIASSILLQPQLSRRVALGSSQSSYPQKPRIEAQTRT